MEVPGHSADTGWYKNGPIPGTVGSAVIAGHLNGPDMEPGVFARLDQLKKGDSIQIFDEKGQVTFFEVRETKVYSFSEHPQEVFFSQEGIHLNLITCMGNWNRIHNQFTKRLVVFADKVE
jgi:LPXTG-site transpeptidase (sortase) family protein